MRKLLQRYPVNRVGRTFIAGDLHGCYDQFMWLLDKINFNKAIDIMYQEGDLGDRGPDSEKCFELCREPWFRPVEGNHERMLRWAVESPELLDWENWGKHGGNWAIRMSSRRRKHYYDLIKDLPAVIVVGEGEERFNIFHAEFYGSDKDLDKLEFAEDVPHELLWDRKIYKGEIDLSLNPNVQKGLSRSFVGHTITPYVKQIGSQIYIDTGSYYALHRDVTPYGVSVIEPATMQVWTYRKDYQE